jgi:hypothetical protein
MGDGMIYETYQKHVSTTNDAAAATVTVITISIDIKLKVF